MTDYDPTDLELASAFRTALRQTVFLTRRLDLDAELSAAQLSVLNMLSDEGLRVSKIAANLGVRVPSATDQISRLESAGLLERRADPSDSRAVVVSLTESGRIATEQANRRRNALMAGILARLEPRERAQLTAVMPVFDKINSYFESPGTPGHSGN